MKNWIGRTAKRTLDLAISGPMLVLLLIPFLIIGFAIRVESGKPSLFRQVRVGRGGRTFRLWKFRTMTKMRVDPQPPEMLEQDEPRITRVGRNLRNFGLDELPQLFNVLTGEMSLVGPRPTLTYQVAAYSDFQHRRLEVRPGITSLAVVLGRNALSWEKRIELDVQYIDHWSFWLDVRILFRTLWKVLVTHKGVYGIDGVNDPFVRMTEPVRKEDRRDT